MKYTKLWLMRLKLQGHHLFDSRLCIQFNLWALCLAFTLAISVIQLFVALNQSVSHQFTQQWLQAQSNKSGHPITHMVLNNSYLYSWGSNAFLCKDQLWDTAKVILYHSIVEPFRKDLISTLTMTSWPLTPDLCSWHCLWLLLERQKGHVGACSCFSELDSEASTV